MESLGLPPPNGRPILLVTAAPAEAAAVVRGVTGRSDAPAPPEWRVAALTERVHLLVTGIGKVNAAVAVATTAHPERCSAVINLGVCGALPGSGLSLGAIVISTASVYADEGLAAPDGFRDCAAMGFPLGGAADPCFAGSEVPSDLTLAAMLAARLGPGAVAARIATVSTCSGTGALAQEVERRTGAAAEAMEGAAIAHALRRLHGDRLPFAEARVVSNTTGDRPSQRWDLRRALAVLESACAAIARPD